MFDPWGGSWSRSLGATAELPTRAELVAALGAEVGAVGPRSGLAWEESWLEAEVGVREEDGRLVVDHRFNLTSLVRVPTLAIAVLPLACSIPSGLRDACRPAFLPWALVLVSVMAGAQIYSRVRIGRLVRRAVARAEATRPARLPVARAVGRGLTRRWRRPR